MSDGPHRSLPMRPGWKRTAERADTASFESADITAAACRALEQDWRQEMSESCLRRLAEICVDQQQLSLLGDARIAELAAQRRALDGLGSLGGVVVDCLQEALAGGKSGAEALHEAAGNALNDRLQRNARQIEEHYLRYSKIRGLNMRQRLSETLGQVSIGDVLNRVLRVGDRAARRSDKQQGLDDGVTLS